VNAANEGCLGGGGVDGAISFAGGPNLAKARWALPIVSEVDIRCQTGSAVTTGPGDYGDLNVPFVVHAVGPNYHHYKDFEIPDKLLRSAYLWALDQCQQHQVTDAAFSLLSAGVYRGRRNIRDVLTIGIQAIQDWSLERKENASLKTVTLCGFTDEEVLLLLDICKVHLEMG
jgi:O-acetyl-ADP-ribose deacetylase